MATLAKKRKRGAIQDDTLPVDRKTAKVGDSVPKKQRHLDSKSHQAETGQTPAVEDVTDEYTAIQIVTGSYDRGVLHGITASLPTHILDPLNSRNPLDDPKDATKVDATKKSDVAFADNFLFAAHASSIRCLGISPPSETGKRTLATGGSDERINLYTLSTTPPTPPSKAAAPTKAPLPALSQPSNTSQNPKNRSIGNLLHHDRAITRLYFPAKKQLFSSAEDNNISISRTRDWTLMESIHAPVPKPVGRPSGDTAGPGEVPAGINDFAVHPSMKLMLSVGRGERCLRLWNLMTGKKAGVLNFDKQVLAQAGEGKFSSGEGRRAIWSEDGEIFVVVFERGALVYGIDCKVKAVIKPNPGTKLHQVRFLPKMDEDEKEVLAASTEDGRVLFFHIDVSDNGTETNGEERKAEFPICQCIAQLGGRAAGVSGRIKDFEILSMFSGTKGTNSKPNFLVVTASSDGTIRLWVLQTRQLTTADGANGTSNGDELKGQHPMQVGTLAGVLETGNRITCLGAFVMDGKPEDSGQGVNMRSEGGVADDSADDDEDDRGSENGSWAGFDEE